MKLPEFFIVGSPKCGTSAMFAYLSEHPDIFMPAFKEPHYYGSDLKWADEYPSISVRNTEDFHKQFEDAKPEQKVGEGSIWYLWSKKAATEIYEACPHAKHIIMLRNPVEMMYSLHNNFIISHNEDIEIFEDALDAEEDRAKGNRIPDSAWFPEALQYRKVCHYSEQIERYINVFGKENILVLLFDDFIKETPEIYKKTLQFLDVRDDFVPDFKQVNVAKGFRSKTLHNLLGKPPKSFKWAVKKILPQKIRPVVASLLKTANKTIATKQPINEETRKKINQEFLPEFDRLSKLLDRDLSCWSC